MSKKDKREESFFEEEDKKPAANIIKDKENKYGEFYNRNVVYKYKDGVTCTVTYSEDKAEDYIERIMN